MIKETFEMPTIDERADISVEITISPKVLGFSVEAFDDQYDIDQAILLRFGRYLMTGIRSYPGFNDIKMDLGVTIAFDGDLSVRTEVYKDAPLGASDDSVAQAIRGRMLDLLASFRSLNHIN